MLNYALWTLFGAVAQIGKSQGTTIIINFFFGTIVNAAYAVAVQVEGFIVQFARSLNSAAIPQITKNYSVGNRDRSINLTSYISKYTYLLMAVVAFPVLLETDFLLGLWLKEVPVGASLFCKLIILNGLISCLGEGIPALVNATGNIKTYQLVFHTFNLLGLPIAFVVYKIGAEPSAILWVYCIINLAAAVLRIWLLKRIFNFDVSLFVKRSYIKILIVSIPLAVFYYFYNPTSFSIWGHLLGMAGSVLFLFVVIAIFGLDIKERDLVKQYIANYKNKHSKK
jgi:O-antigen/teichoic acid export membrane protein